MFSKAEARRFGRRRRRLPSAPDSPDSAVQDGRTCRWHFDAGRAVDTEVPKSVEGDTGDRKAGDSVEDMSAR